MPGLPGERETMNKILIGIDPDVEFSGFAKMYISQNGEKEMSIMKFRFFEMFDFFKRYTTTKTDNFKIKVYIEAGWLNLKSNWHVSGHGERVSARIGTKVGANHQVGKLIAEMCEYLGLEYELVQPRTSKYSIKQFRMMTGYKGKLDQDQVDAALLIIGR